MENEKCKYYLQDLISFIKEEARNAKLTKDTSAAKDADYNIGYLMAYHEVISLKKQQAIVFDIDQEELGLDDIDPELHLL